MMLIFFLYMLMLFAFFVMEILGISNKSIS